MFTFENLHRTCCDLVPFGSGGDFGSEHSALRTLVYVPRGRQCPRRAGHSRCDSARAVVAHAGTTAWLLRAWNRRRYPHKSPSDLHYIVTGTALLLSDAL
jgi:hypothetical protein